MIQTATLIPLPSRCNTVFLSFTLRSWQVTIIHMQLQIIKCITGDNHYHHNLPIQPLRTLQRVNRRQL